MNSTKRSYRDLLTLKSTEIPNQSVECINPNNTNDDEPIRWTSLELLNYFNKIREKVDMNHPKDDENESYE